LVGRSFRDSTEHPKLCWVADTLALEVQLQKFNYFEGTLAYNPFEHFLPERLLILHALSHFIVFSLEVVSIFPFLSECGLVIAGPLGHTLAQWDTRAQVLATHSFVNCGFDTVIEVLRLFECFFDQWVEQSHWWFVVSLAEGFNILRAHLVNGEDGERDGTESQDEKGQP